MLKINFIESASYVAPTVRYVDVNVMQTIMSSSIDGRYGSLGSAGYNAVYDGSGNDL